MRIKSIAQLFKLEAFVIHKIEDETDKILIWCRARRRGIWHEGQYSEALSTSRTKTARHAMIENRPVILKITQRKFYFKKSDKRLWEPLPIFQKEKHDSNFFRENTLKTLKVSNYTGASASRLTSKMFPLRLLDDIGGFKVNWDPDCHRLGLDGKGVRKHRMVTNITNLDRREVVSVLPSYDQRTLEKWCQSLTLGQRLQITEIAVDMSDVPIATLKKYFPRARLVTDQFHVIRHAIRLMDQHRSVIEKTEKVRIPIKHELSRPIHKLRQEEFDKMKPLLDRHRTLKCFWKTIHQLRKVYWQADHRKARSRLRYVIWLCEQNGIPEMEALAKTLRGWFDEILSYYISKTTNAYTEGVHTRFELIKRQHFGIRNMERFAKRVLFCLMPLAIFTQLLSNFVK